MKDILGQKLTGIRRTVFYGLCALTILGGSKLMDSMRSDELSKQEKAIPIICQSTNLNGDQYPDLVCYNQSGDRVRYLGSRDNQYKLYGVTHLRK